MAENFLKQDENLIQEAKLGQSKIHKTRHIVRKNCKGQNQSGGEIPSKKQQLVWQQTF